MPAIPDGPPASPDGAGNGSEARPEVRAQPEGAGALGSTEVAHSRGLPTDGSATDGSATDGSPTDGSATDGSATDGSATDGLPTDGTRDGADEQAAGRVPAVAPAEPSYRRGKASWPDTLAVFVLTLGLSLALYHNATLHSTITQVGGAGDADEYSWFLSWLPFALTHGIDPLVSHVVNAPGGINLMWNTSVILPSFLVSPLTAIFGAAFAYNVLAISAPVFTATFCYVAFRRWTGRLPAFVGSLLVGFSPYMVAQSAGHLASILIMTAPLFLIMLDRILVVQLSRPWWDGVLLGVLAVAQLLTGEEVLSMELIAAAIGTVVLCAAGHRQARAHFPYAARSLGYGAATFAVLAAPFLAVQFAGPYRKQDVHPYNAYVSDLLNFIVPTNVTKIAPAFALHISAHFTGNGSEDNAYIGIPMLAFALLSLFLARRRPVAWVAAAVALGSAIISMGPTLHFSGRVTRHGYLPDYLLQKLPIIHNLLPDRFASMMTVGLGLLVALGCDALRKQRWPAMAGGWALAALGVAFVVPASNFPSAASPEYTAFTTGWSCPASTGPHAPRKADPPIALVVPATNELDLRWQAEAAFCFVMPYATGMTGTNSGDVHGGVLYQLGNPSQPPVPHTPAVRAEAAQELQQLHISEVIVAPESPTSPGWSPQGQAYAVAWVEWLLGQRPVQSQDNFLSYVWKDLPPLSDIASGNVPAVPGAPPP
ncbi:MAG TPA: hypothetical protein VME46_02995 [Acidimicrobiales bacterium]|nr:hypothetical protein [Acidimicrobiales bacterium]